MRARDNPFAVARVLRVRYRLDEAGWGALLSRLESAGWRGAIVGPHGSGKTTLLEDLGVRLEARGLAAATLRLDDLAPRLCAATIAALRERLTARHMVLLDGGELLSRGDWRRLESLVAGARGLVVTAHARCRLPTLHGCITTPELLHAIVADILARAGYGIEVSEAECRRLHAVHAGNLRDALRELYDARAEVDRGLDPGCRGG